MFYEEDDTEEFEKDNDYNGTHPNKVNRRRGLRGLSRHCMSGSEIRKMKANQVLQSKGLIFKVLVLCQLQVPLPTMD
jgi:hypothetical protein